MDKIKELEITLKEKARAIYSEAIEQKNSIGAKDFEIGFQDVIEAVYCTKEYPCWWQVCDLDIFMHLLEYKSPMLTIKAILNHIMSGEEREAKMRAKAEAKK